jgi:hypothetical protein
VQQRLEDGEERSADISRAMERCNLGCFFPFFEEESAADTRPGPVPCRHFKFRLMSVDTLLFPIPSVKQSNKHLNKLYAAAGAKSHTLSLDFSSEVFSLSLL